MRGGRSRRAHEACAAPNAADLPTGFEFLEIAADGRGGGVHAPLKILERDEAAMGQQRQDQLLAFSAVHRQSLGN